MLWDIDKRQEVSRISHADFYDARISRLSPQHFQAIQEVILRRIEGDEVAVAGWIPGSNWTGTPFQSIHEDFWGFMRDVVVHDAPVDSMTDFRVNPQLRRKNEVNAT